VDQQCEDLKLAADRVTVVGKLPRITGGCCPRRPRSSARPGHGSGRRIGRMRELSELEALLNGHR